MYADADERAWDAARSGVRFLDGSGELSERVVTGVSGGDGGSEKLEMGVGSLGDIILGEGEGILGADCRTIAG